MSVQPPFTERHKFSGPNTALSVHVAWDDERRGYLASSDHGWHGFSDLTADVAALNCFRGWVTGDEDEEITWFDPSTEPERSG